MASQAPNTSNRPPTASVLQRLGHFLIQMTNTPSAPSPEYPNAPANASNTTPTDIGQDLQTLRFRDVDTVFDFIQSAFTGVTNDKDMLLERLIQMLAKLPPTSRNQKRLTDGLIHDLWNDLNHPPVTTLGRRFLYRQPDGSGNNIRHSTLGAANTYYTRSVKPVVFQNPNPPDPSMMFDSLFARPEQGFRPHPNNLSSFFFYFATVITHDLFQTSGVDPNMNLSSSYLDLSPLYGRNESEQASVRLGKQGLLKPDCFSSKRVHGFPPGVGVILVLFNRYHNFVVTQLAKINEGGRFKKPEEAEQPDSMAWKKYDNDLFQTGRLVTCGLCASIVLGDYLRTILNLNRVDTSWNLDPRAKEGKGAMTKSTPEAVGNQVSVEFNLIYRWHTAMSERDETWMHYHMSRLLDGADPTTASQGEMMKALRAFEKSIPSEPEKRDLGNIERQDDGAFDDDALAKVLRQSINDTAGAFGPYNVPPCMRAIEVLGMTQARSWNVATLNEFRDFMGLKRYQTFEDINPDPQVAKLLATFYDSPDSIELYTGIQAEKPKEVVIPGSGLCPPPTTARAILADATALVRGDRFYTADFTPRNITNWAYNEIIGDPKVNSGHMFHKLMYRALPYHFTHNSVYAHFPFVVPAENDLILNSLGISSTYSWDEPRLRPPVQMIRSHEAAKQVLNNTEEFKIPWIPGTERAFAGDDSRIMESRRHFKDALLAAPGWRDEVRRFCEATTWDVLRRHSATVRDQLVGCISQTHEVDIVRDVISLTITRFMAELFGFRLKAHNGDEGICTDHEFYRELALMFTAATWESDTGRALGKEAKGREAAHRLGKLMIDHVRGDQKKKMQGTFRRSFSCFGSKDKDEAARRKTGDGCNGPADDLDDIREGPSLPRRMSCFGVSFFARLVQGARSVENAIYGTVLPIIMSATANQTILMSQCLDYYLDDGRAHLTEMRRLAWMDTPEGDEKLMKYMLEGTRIRSSVSSCRIIAKDQVMVDTVPCLPHPRDPTSCRAMSHPHQKLTARQLNFVTGNRVVVDVSTASHDAEAIPDPETVRLDRPADVYLQFDWGLHRHVGGAMSRMVLTGMLKTLLRLEGLRRVEGPRGRIRCTAAFPWLGQALREKGKSPAWSGLRWFLSADESAFSPLPASMRVRWDDWGGNWRIGRLCDREG